MLCSQAAQDTEALAMATNEARAAGVAHAAHKFSDDSEPGAQVLSAADDWFKEVTGTRASLSAQLEEGTLAGDAQCDAQALQTAIGGAHAAGAKGCAPDVFIEKITKAEARLRPLLERRAAAESALRGVWKQSRSKQDTEALAEGINEARAVGVAQATHKLSDGAAGGEYVQAAALWRQNVLDARNKAARDIEPCMAVGAPLLARAGLKPAIEAAVASGDEGVAPAALWAAIHAAQAQVEEVTRVATDEILGTFAACKELTPPELDILALKEAVDAALALGGKKEPDKWVGLKELRTQLREVTTYRCDAEAKLVKAMAAKGIKQYDANQGLLGYSSTPTADRTPTFTLRLARTFCRESERLAFDPRCTQPRRWRKSTR
jgi:hypothetical protein